MTRRERLPMVSRSLHWVDDHASRSAASVIAAVSVGLALLAIAASGFDLTLQADFATACSAVTVVMVFVLQHTQRRSQVATQLKLDELIAAMPQADDRIVHVEASTNEELADLGEERARHHASLRAPAGE
jgi:low affinity Fe/Cu permease